jgi:hypothetical protein
VNKSLNRVADKLISDSDRFKRLQELGNRKNYPNKVKRLTAKITEEHDFWSKKNPSQKLEDLKRDLTFIQSTKEPSLSKDRIDTLMEKYGLK